jgi:hypothetical protein
LRWIKDRASGAPALSAAGADRGDGCGKAIVDSSKDTPLVPTKVDFVAL